jgi:serine/threonine-protein kinase
MPFPAGALIAGKYRLERLLGEGATGCVMLATHVNHDRLVAVKLVQPWHATDGVDWDLREAGAAARIESEHVARVTDTGVLGDGSSYLVMEYLDGQTLKALLEERRRLPAPLAIAYTMQACEGLAAAHALGIVHRDLKPSNLFLARQTDRSTRVKLLDFGVSRSVRRSAASLADDEASPPFVAWPLYLAPEQILAGDVDRRTDVWALGVVLYEMLAGHTPFDGATLPEVCASILEDTPAPVRTKRPDVPAALEAVVMQCLQRDPKNRFRSIAALARALAVCGTPGARASAERTRRILQRDERNDPSAPKVDSVVPDASLTQTSFGRAVEGIEGILTRSSSRAEVRPPRPIPVVTRQAPETPPAFTTPARPPARALPVMPLLVATGAIAVGIVMGLASHLGDRPSTTASAQGHATPAATPEPAQAVAPSWTAVAMPAPSPPATATPSSVANEGPASRRTPTRHSLPTATATAPAAVTAPAASNGPPRPAPAATKTAAPIGTGGFGGRE